MRTLNRRANEKGGATSNFVDRLATSCLPVYCEFWLAKSHMLSHWTVKTVTGLPWDLILELFAHFPEFRGTVCVDDRTISRIIGQK